MTLSRFLFFLVLLLSLGLRASALQQPVAAPDHAKTAEQNAAAPERDTGDDVYRHSASVRLLAKWLHLDLESAALLFEYLNFAILAGAILYALLKYLPKTFRANRENIQHQLVDARTATQQAQDRLAAIEQRLGRLDEEIAAISKQAETDSVEDEARIKASIETERRRIIEAATRDIAAATTAAQRDLKQFAAGLAVDRASQKIVLTADDDRSLVQEFARSIGHQPKGGGNN